MATTNYSWTLPTVGGNENNWGDIINAAIEAIDVQMKSNADAVPDAFPSGGIILWSGAIVDIPSGWYLCDGNNGTPNLRDRFVIGAGSTYGVGVTGGASSVTLTSANIPAHTHSFSGTTSSTGGHNHSGTTSTNGSHTHSFTKYGPYGQSGVFNYVSASDGSYTGYTQVTSAAGDHSHTFTTSSVGDHAHTFSGTTGSYGSGTAFSALPPYYALAYIMKA